MKFLCDNCKAKYQIADEKLAGRAVRMQCRKCGHMIDVPSPTAAGATLSSVVARNPTLVSPATVADAVESASILPPAPDPAKIPARPAPPPRPVRPAPAVSPRPSPTATTPRSLPTSQPKAPSPVHEEKGGLAGAFARSVKKEDESVATALDMLSATTSEEWYVGVGGVPLGPVRLSTLRQKAAQGLISEESLVWREGFDEWLPLRTFPELVAIVHEARDGVRNLTAPVGGTSPARKSYVPPAPVLVEAPHAPLASHPIAVVETAPVLDMFGSASAPQHLADPFASPKTDFGLLGLGLPGEVAPKPSSVPTPSRRADDRMHSANDLALTGRSGGGRIHPAAWAFIAMAGLFGVSAAFFIFAGTRTPQPAPTVQVVTVTAPAAQTAAPVAANPTTTAESTEITAPVVRVPGPLNPRPASSDDKAVAAADTKGATTAAPPGLGGLPGVGLTGPTPNGPRPGADNSNLPALDGKDVERVVSSQRGLVSRQCWQPAMAAKEANAPKSAKVSVSMTIGPDGSVSSTSATGGAGYPGLASCISSRVKSWKFPSSSGSSNFNIPFTFIEQ